MKGITRIVLICLCVYIGISSPIKYFIANEPVSLLALKPEKVVNSTLYMITFFIHITLGGIALIIGWIQFIKRFRINFPKTHRIIGKIYVSSILLGGPIAFYISFYASGGWFAEISFAIGATLWILITYIAYKAVRNGDIKTHSELMAYSYAGTFAAVTLRLWLPTLLFFVKNFNIAYGLSIWLSWVPNMLITYLILNHKQKLIKWYNHYKIATILKSIVLIAGICFSLSYTSLQTWFYKKPSFKGSSLSKNIILKNSLFTHEKLNELKNYLKEETETTSMMILEHGKIVFQYGDVSEISTIGDSKTGIISLLYGKYVENRSVDLHETLNQYNINEYKPLPASIDSLTLHHLLTSSSGINYLKDNQNYYTLPSKTTKNRPYFMFNHWDYNLATSILEKQYNLHFHQELETQLAKPLQFEDWNSKNQKTIYKNDSKYPFQEIHISTRDMAKIGQLLLQKGQWNGEQILSKKWVEQITSTQVPRTEVRKNTGTDISSPVQFSYGYLWWIFERFYDNHDFKGAFTSWDESGQYITVIPKRNVVIAHKTKLDVLTHLNLSNRTKTPSWKYWWILRNLMLNKKPIESMEPFKTSKEIITTLKNEHNKPDAKYAISERLINEYGLSLAARGKHSQAIEVYKLNLELYPNHGYYTHRIYQYYAESLLQLNQKKEALTMFKNSLTWNPQNTKAKKRISELQK